MNYEIRIFQLEENGGGTDIQMVSGTERVYTSTTVDPDFFPEEINGIENSIEYDEGVFATGTLNILVRYLEEDYFNGYVDVLNEPYCITVKNVDTAEVLFVGIINRESTSYNPGTKKTAISAWAWDYILEQVNTAARTVYETQLFADFDYSIETEGSTAEVKIPRYVSGDDLSLIVGTGDVLVFETPNGEHRGVIQSITINTDDLDLVIDAPVTLDILASTTVASGDVDVININVGPQTIPGIQFTITDRDTWATLANQDTEIVVGIIETTSGDKYAKAFLRDAPYDIVTWFIGDDQETVTFQFVSKDATLNDDLNTNGFDFELKQGSTAKAGTSVRILGKELYGYAPADINAKYDVDEVIEALFTLTNVGVLQYVADTFTVPASFNCQLDKWIELPANLLDSLRQIQNNCASFLKLIPSTDGSNLPRLEVAVIPRTSANTTDLTSYAISDIVSYTENPADFTPSAVVVTPAVEYFKPKSENDNIETVGFYYDGVDSAIPQLSGRPSGPDVVEVTINLTPAYAGDLFTGEGIAVRNDTLLKEVARKIYQFYQNLNRPCTFVVDSILADDQLGNFATINEGGLQRTIFVTSINFDPKSKQTTCEGRVGEFVDATTADPVARITGTRVYRDTDGGGTETITLSGLSSYDPLGGSLTYEWQVNPPSAPAGTGPTLQTSLAVGTHTVQLEVTKPVTLETDTVSVSVEILPDNEIDDDGDNNIAQFTAYFPSVDSSGDVYLTAAGNSATKTTGGIRVETSTDDISYSAIGGSPFNNPQDDLLIASGLSEDSTLWIRVTLISLDGTDGEQRKTQITNLATPGVINADQITVDDLIVQNSASFDLASAEVLDIDIDGNDVALFEETEVTVSVDFSHEGSTLKLLNGTARSQLSAIGKLTDSSGGSAGATIAAVSGSGDDTTINDNLASLNAKIDALIDVVGDSAGFSLTAD